MKHIIYRTARKSLLFRSLTVRIEAGMKILYPGASEKVICRTERELIKTGLIMLGTAAIFLLYGGLDPIVLFMAIGMAEVLVKNCLYVAFDGLEMKLLQQFEKYLTEVNFHFRAVGSVEEAVLEAARDADEEMALQAYRLYDALQDDREEVPQEFCHHFLLTFYALCRTVKIYGDKKVGEQSVFLSNLGFLKQDVKGELLLREKKNAQFLGLVPMTVAPVAAIKPIHKWAIGNIGSLAVYYSGIAGRFTEVCIAVLTFLLAHMIMKLRFWRAYDPHRWESVRRLLELKAADRLVMKRIRRRYRYYYRLDRFLKSVVYPYNVKEFMVYRGICGSMAFLTAMVLLFRVGFWQQGIAGILVMLSIVSLVTVAAYYYGLVMLYVRKRLLRLHREEEVVRFQSVILILMNMDRVTLEVLLFWMEQFAVVFRRPLEELSDSLSYRGREALLEWKDKIAFPPFERLLDCFLASESVGIGEAFSEVMSDRSYYVERHKQENELVNTNKAMIAKLFAFVPMGAVLIFVLVVPFIYVGLLRLQGFR